MANITETVNDVAEPRIPADEVRKTLGEVLDRVTDGERIVVTRHDRDRVALVPLKDLERLRVLDARAAAVA